LTAVNLVRKIVNALNAMPSVKGIELNRIRKKRVSAPPRPSLVRATTDEFAMLFAWSDGLATRKIEGGTKKRVDTVRMAS
jgi:hypothetical protein